MIVPTRAARILASAAVVTCAALAGRAQSAASSVREVLDRAGVYVANYEARFAAVVSEETYRQTQQRVAGLTIHRDLKSDVLVISLGQSDWMGFRDVFEVDGKPVRDHDQRLSKLFLEPTANSVNHARQIADESARYNLGSVRRNINVPTMALAFLRRENQVRSTFSRDGTAKVDDIATIVLAFKEHATPTIVRSGDADSPATGRFWIEPDTGRVVRSQVRLAPRVNATITVTYGAQPKLDVWVPVSMSETYRSSSGEIVAGAATYSNFRRFSVDVTTIIK
jgi:hypothetical protein